MTPGTCHPYCRHYIDPSGGGRYAHRRCSEYACTLSDHTSVGDGGGIGTLEFTDGYPTGETAARLRDHLDYLHGV